jgi:hypothetical protein
MKTKPKIKDGRPLISVPASALGSESGEHVAAEFSTEQPKL